MNAIEISRSALDVEWRRLEISAQNLANMNSTRTESGDVYRPLRLVSRPIGSFQAMMSEGTNAAIGPRGVGVVALEPLPDGLRRVHEPNHPHADADGFVTYPNVDHAGEMTLMIRASRVYEANLAAVSIASDMYSRALELGRQA